MYDGPLTTIPTAAPRRGTPTAAAPAAVAVVAAAAVAVAAAAAAAAACPCFLCPCRLSHGPGRRLCLFLCLSAPCLSRRRGLCQLRDHARRWRVLVPVQPAIARTPRQANRTTTTHQPGRRPHQPRRRPTPSPPRVTTARAPMQSAR